MSSALFAVTWLMTIAGISRLDRGNSLFRITARTVLELGAELISSDIIAFYELIKNGFDAQAGGSVPTKRAKSVDVAFDIVLPRHPFLKFRDRIELEVSRSAAEATSSAAGGPTTLVELHLDPDDAAVVATSSPKRENLAALKEDLKDAFLTNASIAAREAYSQAIDAAANFEALRDALRDAQAKYNTVTVSDRGSGMSAADLNEAFLVIGTPSRKREVEAALTAGATTSPFLGEKGIGRLSAMRLGDRLNVNTATASDTSMNTLEIDWRAFADMDAMLDQIPLSPSVGGAKSAPDWSGTDIVISDLLEQWTEARVRAMCEKNFAKLTDPSEDAARRPRIVITWNGERIAIPFMPKRLTDAAHAKVTGHYRIEDGEPLLVCTLEASDLGFEHPPVTETVVLAPVDLQGMLVGKDGEIEDDALVRLGSFSFEAYWYNRRRLSRADTTGETKSLRDLQEEWGGIRLYRDGFRVFPYGEEDDDWLELDRTALRRRGYLMNKTQFVGRALLGRAENPRLVDQTNREGLRATPEQQAFLLIMREAVQGLLGNFMAGIERDHKSKQIDLSEAKGHVEELKGRAQNSIRKLRRLAKDEDTEAVADLEQILLELSDFAERARLRIEQVEKEGRQMVDMAGVGLMVEVVAHELARSSENALKSLERLQGAQVPEGVRGHLNTLRAEMKSLNKRIRVLDPLSVSGRQRRETFSLDELIKETLEAHQAQFERHKIQPSVQLRPVRVRAVKGMVVQILENLISNSIYWLDMKRDRQISFRPQIRITLDSGPPTITYEDNGRGIAPENAEKVFRPFFSLKDVSRRRGLGLFIAREAANYHGGSLNLDDVTDPETHRLHRFVLELPEDSQV